MPSVPAETDAQPRAVDAKTIDDRFGLVGKVLGGKFRIDRTIAEGGFGLVYSGWHLDLNVQVAVKVMRVPETLGGTSREAFVESFVSEARMIARMKHPNIVSVLDLGLADVEGHGHVPWMALEWLDGKTLSKLVKERGGQPMHPREALALLRPIFDALSHAHDEGIAHRDIKPANVMLAARRRGTTPMLLDFGIAKVMEGPEIASEGETQSTGIVQAFSPQYAAPEQISRSRTGPWTDVHALGLLMSQLLLGRRPYAAKEVTEIFREALSDPRPTPAKFGVSVGAWDTVLAKSVAFRPSDRFATAGEFLRALEETLDDAMPIDATIEPPPTEAASRPSMPTDSRVRSVVPVTAAADPSLDRVSSAARAWRRAAFAVATLVGVGSIATLVFARQHASVHSPAVRAMATAASVPVATAPTTAQVVPAPAEIHAPVVTPPPSDTTPVPAPVSTLVSDEAPASAERRHRHRAPPTETPAPEPVQSAPQSEPQPQHTPTQPVPRIVD